MIRRPPRSTLSSSSAASDVYKRQAFEDVMIVKSNIDVNMPIDTNRYAVYRGDNAELVFKNNLEASNSVILIKDSFGLPVYSFLAPAIKETSALDMRYFDENVVEYAKGNNPDVVIIMYNADSCLLYTSDAADEED